MNRASIFPTQFENSYEAFCNMGRSDGWYPRRFINPRGCGRFSELKIELRLEHGQLGLYDPKTGKKLLTYEEAQDALQAEQGARRAAEAEAARLREELARLKGSG